MTEAILLALWIGTALFFICREIKINDDRKSHEYWLSELQDCLHNIESEFRRQCQEQTKAVFLQYNEQLNKIESCCTDFAKEHLISALLDDLREYGNAIDESKKQYIDNVYDKVIAKGMSKYNLTTIPTYLMREYERNLTEIADTFRDFRWLMWEQAIEKK